MSTRPLGVRGVTNPLAATGGEDREDGASLRRSAALHSLTLGRLVSLRDYQDFARGFSGFAKAHATITSDGERQAIFVTVAPAGGGPLSDTAPSFENLRSAMRLYGDPQVSFTLKPWRPGYFQIVARVAITAMPELVALLHSFVGLAAVLVGVSTFLDPAAHLAGAEKIVHDIEIFLDVGIGAVTFTGSVVAWGKLSGRISGRPILLPGRHALNLVLAPESWKEGRVYETTVDGSARRLRGARLLRRGDDYARVTFEWVGEAEGVA